MTQQRRSIKGTLIIRADSAAELKKYETWDAGTPSLRITKSTGPPLARQNRWLWYAFDYHLDLNFQHHSGSPGQLLLGTNRLLKSKFYPFQRLFYLSIQSRIDRGILSLLKAKAAGRSTTKPLRGAIYLPDPKTAFISRPIPSRPAGFAFNPTSVEQAPERDVFNTNALMTALLASSDEPPVTTDNTAGPTFVASTAPQNMLHASVWESALTQPSLRIDGVQLSNLGFATIDNDGHLAEISAASVSSSEPGIRLTRISEASALRNLSAGPIQLAATPFTVVHGLPDGSRFDSPILRENPIQAVPSGYVLTGDIQLYGIIPAKLYSFQGTASDGGVRETVTIADDLPLAQLFPDSTELDSVSFQNVQLRYSDTPTADNPSTGTWLEGDLIFQGALEPLADVLRSTFGQADPKLHMEFLIGMDRNWNTLEMPGNFSITGSLEGTSVKFGDLVEFTRLGVKIHVNKEYDPSPYREFFSLNFGFFGEALITMPGSIVPLHMDFTMALDEGVIDLSMVLRDPSWENAFGITGLTVSDACLKISRLLSTNMSKLSSIELSTSFTIQSPPATISFDVGAILLSETDLISLRGYYMQGKFLPRGPASVANLEFH
jgi:hypothetical protein